MRGQRVVNVRADPEFCQSSLEAIAVRVTNDVLVIDVSAARSYGGEDEARPAKPLAVGRRDFQPATIAFFQISQSESQNGCLNFIQPAIDAGRFADPILIPTILTQRP